MDEECALRSEREKTTSFSCNVWSDFVYMGFFRGWGSEGGVGEPSYADGRLVQREGSKGIAWEVAFYEADSWVEDVIAICRKYKSVGDCEIRFCCVCSGV